jgi:hypothetical protein
MDGQGVPGARPHADYRWMANDGGVFQATVEEHAGTVADAERGEKRALGFTTKDTKEHKGLENCAVKESRSS